MTAEEAREWCNENEPPFQEPTVAHSAGFERISWPQAFSWWPYRPLFKATSPPLREGAEEVLFAWSVHEGRKGNPQADHSGLDVIYQYPPSTVDTKGYFGLIESGAFIVRVAFYPPGQEVPYGAVFAEKNVLVRGHPAWLTEARRKEGNNVDFRWIYWHEPAVSGGNLLWQIANHPDLYSEPESIEFTDRLQEVR